MTRSHVRFTAAGLLLVASVSFAQLANTWTESAQALTRAAPTLATEGISLMGAKGFTVMSCAAAGQTVTSGAVDLHFYDPGLAAWVENTPLSIDAAEHAGKRCAIESFEVVNQQFRVLAANDALVISSGAATRVSITVQR